MPRRNEFLTPSTIKKFESIDLSSRQHEQDGNMRSPSTSTIGNQEVVTKLFVDILKEVHTNVKQQCTISKLAKEFYQYCFIHGNVFENPSATSQFGKLTLVDFFNAIGKDNSTLIISSS